MINLLVVFFSFFLGELKITSIILFDVECLFGGGVVILAVAYIIMVSDVG